MTFGGNICIHKNGKEVLPSSAWDSLNGSAESGGGHESWDVTPTDASSPIAPLNGTGTIHINGHAAAPKT